MDHEAHLANVRGVRRLAAVRIQINTRAYLVVEALTAVFCLGRLGDEEEAKAEKDGELHCSCRRELGRDVESLK